MDLPQFSVMPAGLDDWERIWARRDGIPSILEPAAARRRAGACSAPRSTSCGRSRGSPRRTRMSKEGDDLGIPARVFPQWLRCTGCDLLGPLPRFNYTQHPPVPDRPGRLHTPSLPRPQAASTGATGRKRGQQPGRARALPAGLHQRAPRRVPVRPVGAPRRRCAKAEVPGLKMRDANVGKRPARRSCAPRCGLTRPMSEAQGEVGRDKLPPLPRPAPAPRRVRADGCDNESRADHDRRLEPVVRRHPVGDRHAAHRCRGGSRTLADQIRVDARRRAGPAVSGPADVPSQAAGTAKVDVDRPRRRRS